MERNANTVDWNVYAQGTGNLTLVFLHYFGGSGRAWLNVMACLGDSYRCIAPDLRGFGESSEVGEDYTIAYAASDVQDLIEALELRDYVLVGHSMGGKIAMMMAAQSPPGLRGLILVAPSPPTSETMTAQARRQALAAHGDHTAAQHTLDSITALPLRPALRIQAVEDNLQTSSLAWAWWLEHGSREDITPQLERISVPTLAIVGAQDPVISPDLVETAIAQRYATQPTRILPDAGHLLPMEASEALSKMISEFLQHPLSDSI